MNRKIEIEVYETERGACPFLTWLRRLGKSTRVRVMAHLDRLTVGNFGASKALGGGLYEIRVHCGAGYRVYYGKYGDSVVLLLCGGDKGSQRNDIIKAREYWKNIRPYLQQGGKSGSYKKL